MKQLTPDELKAVLNAVKGSIDLYGKYVKLNPETTAMARRQRTMGKRLILLRSAQEKLK